LWQNRFARTGTARIAQLTQFVRKDTDMTARFLSVAGFALIVVGTAAQASADWFFGIPTEVKRRQCWPEPFDCADRSAVRAPFVAMVANGWRRQNMLGEFHFEPDTGQLNEAGRLKVRWILTSGPQQHRLIYVHVAEKSEEMAARMAAVQLLAAQISPTDLPPILPTTIADDGWPADHVDLIGRKYQQSTPPPRLPTSTGSGNGSSPSGGSP